MTSYIEKSLPNVKGLNYYFTRTTDIQIIFNNNHTKMFFYCKISHFIFVGNVFGLDSSNFINCEINKIGERFQTNNMILNDKDIVGFLQSQIKRANEFTFSDKQQKIIEDRIFNDFEKYIKSKSFEARFLDYLREGED